MLKKVASGVLDALLSSRTIPYAPVVKLSAALLDEFFQHSHLLFFVLRKLLGAAENGTIAK
jgi:hypothetical protein